MGACLSKQEILRFHAHEMDEDGLRRVREHLASCGSCGARSEKALLEHDSLVAQLRAVGMPPARGKAPEVGDVREAMGEIKGYELVEEISRGGQGVVLRAVQRSTRREVAVKVVREGGAVSSSAARRFEREIELVAGLRHANVVTVFDSGRTRGGLAYLVMELVEGERLDRWVSEQNPVLPELLRVFTEVCAGASHAHQRGVIHRDLKPGNVLVDREGRARILDFGLARLTEPEPGMDVTTTGVVAGTLAYMSPEQARGRPEEIDTRSDVYAIGVMLYEALSGDVPFHAEGNVLETLRAITERSTPRLRTRIGGRYAIDDELETIVHTALSKEPERRYQSALELGRDLDRYMAGETIEAKRDSGWYVLRKTVRRYRAWIGAAAAMFVLVSAAAVALALMYGTAREAERRAERRFEQVRDLARAFIFEFDPMIERLPGSAPARELIVSKGLTYLDGLAREAGEDDVALRLELAQGYATIGDVMGDQNSANLGDLRGALEAHEKARALLEGMIGRPGAPLRAEIEMSYTQFRIADVLAALGDEGGCDRLVVEGYETARRLYERKPEDTSAKRAMAIAHERIVGTLDGPERHGERVAHIEEGLRLAQEIAADGGENLWMARDVAVGRFKLALERHASGDLEGAHASMTEFLLLSELLREAHPEDMVARRDVAAGHEWLCIIQTAHGNLDDAVRHGGACTDIGEMLLAADPSNKDTLVTLIGNYVKRGEAELGAGELEGARRSYERALDLAERAVASRPELALAHRHLGVAMYKLHELAAARGVDQSLSFAERAGLMEEACGWLTRCRGVFLEMRNTGLLAESDRGVPEELAAEVKACESEVVALRGTVGGGTVSAEGERDAP